MDKNLTLMVIAMFLCAVFLGGCGMKLKLPNSEQLGSFHERAKEALATGEGLYASLRLAYLDLRAAGEIDEELHKKVIAANEKLKAAYQVAKEAVESHDEPTIKSALQTLCAMAELSITEIARFASVDVGTIRNARIALVIIKRVVSLV